MQRDDEVRRLTSKLEHALALAAEGFKVFPVAPGKNKPPLLNEWQQKATTDPETVRLFWLAVPDANIGIHCEGLAVVDTDLKKGGPANYAKLGYPATRTARTPGGGEHHFFRLPAGHPGVPNTVGKISEGVDTRSAGGYVVAAGSERPDGVYAWVDQAPLTEAPAALLNALGQAKPPTAPAALVGDAPAEVVERARQWLAGQLPAIEGCGGDAHTFAVAAGLRDHGVSKAQALALLHLWNVTCAPPWSPEELETKVANAYKYAENAPGSKAALPEDFPELMPEPSKTVPKASTLLSLSAFASQQSRSAGYVVKGMLQRRSYAEIYGAPGEGKTFVALDLGYHVSAGRNWMGLKVHAGPVAYLAYEGTGGMVKRAQALRQKYGDKDVPLYVISAAYNLREKTGRAELGDTLALLPTRPVLIVIDTFARALMGGDENSAQDVGAFNSAVAALIESTGACVLIVHHSGKDKSKGARGSSALRGALDTEIEIDGQQIYARKQRDVEVLPAIGFRLAPVMVGLDEDGDEVTSCVVEPAAIPVQGSTRITGQAKMGFDVLCGMSPNNEPVEVKDWKEACREFLGAKGVNSAFFRLKQKLLHTGHVAALPDGRIERRMT